MKSGKSSYVSSTQRPNYKTYLGKPPSITGSIYPSANEKVAYRDPVPKNNEGINRKLYEQTSHQFFSPQLSPKGMYASVFEHDEVRRDKSLPPAPKQQDASPNKFRYNDFRPEPLFPNTPFKQDVPAQYLSNSYDMGYQRGSPLQNGAMSPNMSQNYGNSPLYGEQSPQRYAGNAHSPVAPREEYGYEAQRKGNHTVLPEIVSPTYARTQMSHWPTLQDSAKMRNPMFSSYNFADYHKDAYLEKQRYKPQGYNYASAAEPVATKDFLKSHVTDFAQAKKYDMEQRTRIHPQLGVVSDQGRSEPILKPYAQESQRGNQQQQFNNTMRQEPPRQAPEPQQDNYSPQNQQYQQYQQQQQEQQPYQEEYEAQQQQQQVQSENLHYNRKTVENGKQAQNKNIFTPSPPQGYLTGVNRRPVMIMPPPVMKQGPSEVRSYGPYSTNYKIPSTYPY